MGDRMTELTFCKDYKHNKELRTSFNELASLVFGINFEEWYNKGYWNERYIPFSYMDRGKVVANVSVNLLDLVIDGEIKRAIQIGTVMTHPDYRNQGLSAKLMNIVLKDYENQYDFMYLFANKTVLDFYPKFGFIRASEVQFYSHYTLLHPKTSGLRKLDGSNVDDLNFINKIATDRIPVSKRFGTQNTEGLLMFYCIYVFKEHLYYDEEQEAIVIYTREGEQVDLFDIVSRKEVNIEQILSKITVKDTRKIVYHYTADYPDINIKSEISNDENVLFILTNEDCQFPLQIKHPITSIA